MAGTVQIVLLAIGGLLLFAGITIWLVRGRKPARRAPPAVGGQPGGEGGGLQPAPTPAVPAAPTHTLTAGAEAERDEES